MFFLWHLDPNQIYIYLLPSLYFQICPFSIWPKYNINWLFNLSCQISTSVCAITSQTINVRDYYFMNSGNFVWMFWFQSQQMMQQISNHLDQPKSLSPSIIVIIIEFDQCKQIVTREWEKTHWRPNLDRVNRSAREARTTYKFVLFVVWDDKKHTEIERIKFLAV